MVKEQRITFNMHDVLALRVTCTNCGGQIPFNLPVDSDSTFTMRRTCPHCEQPWHPPGAIGALLLKSSCAACKTWHIQRLLPLTLSP